MKNLTFESKYKTGMHLTYGEEVNLDKTDWDILELLSQDARLPVSRICRELKLSRDVVNYRIKKMIDNDVIAAFITVSNLPKLGYNVWGHVRLSLQNIKAEREKEFMDYVMKNPHITFAFSCLGTWDFGVEFYAKNPGEFYEFERELKAKFPDLIKDVDSTVFIKVYKMRYVPRKVD